MKPLKLFISYSHKDELLLKELENHLAILKRNGVIDVWHDRRIEPGKEWDSEIDNNLKNSEMILLLISADFLASDYCFEKEMTYALEQHRLGNAIVVPIILRPVLWQEPYLSKLQALPKDARAVTTWENQDLAFVDIAKGLLLLSNMFQNNLANESAAKQPPKRKDKKSSPTAKIKFTFILDGKPENLTDLKADEIVTKLKSLAPGCDLTLLEIQKGSILLVLEGNRKLYETILAFDKNAKLEEILGYRIQNITTLDRQGLDKIAEIFSIKENDLKTIAYKESCNAIQNTLHLLAEIIRSMESTRETYNIVSSFHRIKDSISRIAECGQNNQLVSPSDKQVYHLFFNLREEIKDLFHSIEYLNRRYYAHETQKTTRLSYFLRHRCASLPQSVLYGIPELVNELKNIDKILSDMRIQDNISDQIELINLKLLPITSQILTPIIICLERNITTILNKTPDIIRSGFITNQGAPIDMMMNNIAENLPHNTGETPSIWPKTF